MASARASRAGDRDRLSRVRLALWPIGFGAVGGLAAAMATVGIDDPIVESSNVTARLIFLIIIGLSFHISGLIAWAHRPENRTGPLLVAVGFAYMLSIGLLALDASVPHTAGAVFGPLYIVICGHLLLAFPTGRLETWPRRTIIVLGYLDVTVLNLIWLLFEPRRQCDGCPENAVLLFPNRNVAEALSTLEQAAGALLSLIAVAILVRSYRRASPAWRRAYAPVLRVGGLAFAALVVLLIDEGLGTPVGDSLQWLFWSLFSLVPIAFVVGLLQVRLARSAVAPLMLELGHAHTHEAIRAALAKAIGDSELEIVYWRQDEQRYIDASGRPAELPDAGSGRVAHPVVHDRTQVGALIVDSTLVDGTLRDTDVIDAATAAAAITLENQQLQAELRARIEELRASRSRVVDAANHERRAIERNLHDGAQQRLVALSLTLRMARSRVDSQPAAAADLLDEASDQLGAAIDELRELARGIHPAVLSDRGLEPALQALCARATMPINLSVGLDERLPPSVEVAAYYTVAEALTNVAKYAQAEQVEVSIRRVNGAACVEVVDDGVGGADPGIGSGLAGLADRIEALEGTLAIVSPHGRGTTLRAEIPIDVGAGA